MPKKTQIISFQIPANTTETNNQHLPSYRKEANHNKIQSFGGSQETLLSITLLISGLLDRASSS